LKMKSSPYTNALEEMSAHIRRQVLTVAVENGAGHIAPSLSCVDVLVALYAGAMTYEPNDPLWKDRDRLIFSKSHGCYGLYAILAHLGVIPMEEWKGFYTPRSTLAGCSDRRPEYGIEAGCGSLGHGLPIAVGLAYGAKLQGKSYHVFCLVGDGEMQEGTTWEAFQFAVKKNLHRLIVIVDRNRLQAMDFITAVMDCNPDDLERRLEGFGLDPVSCDGHDPLALRDCFLQLKERQQGPPGVVIAETVKGYGVRCMENVPKFHFRLPSKEELEDD